MTKESKTKVRWMSQHTDGELKSKNYLFICFFSCGFLKRNKFTIYSGGYRQHMEKEDEEVEEEEEEGGGGGRGGGGRRRRRKRRMRRRRRRNKHNNCTK